MYSKNQKLKPHPRTEVSIFTKYGKQALQVLHKYPLEILNVK